MLPKLPRLPLLACSFLVLIAPPAAAQLQTIYWADFVEGSIRRMTQTGTGVVEILGPADVSGPTDLAVDSWKDCCATRHRPYIAAGRAHS